MTDSHSYPDMGNDPQLLAKLLRAIAGAEDAKASKHDIIFIEAARWLEHFGAVAQTAMTPDIVEKCAKIADQVAINAERRAAGHIPQSAAQEAAYNKMEGAQEAAHQIRERASALSSTNHPSLDRLLDGMTDENRHEELPVSPLSSTEGK